MSKILAETLKARIEPSINSEIIPDCEYTKGQLLKSGDLIILNDGIYWLRYYSNSGNKKYICAWDTDGKQLIDIPPHIPGPRPNQPNPPPSFLPIPGSVTGLPGIPHQKEFPNENIQKWGCCFLATCVKGGLTDMNQCLDCYNWALENKKIREDCWVSLNKEILAKEISEKYNTPFHVDYYFQTNSQRNHFWLVQNNKEIFNSVKLGFHRE